MFHRRVYDLSFENTNSFLWRCRLQYNEIQTELRLQMKSKRDSYTSLPITVVRLTRISTAMWSKHNKDHFVTG